MTELWTIKKLIDWTTEYLKKHGIEWPHLEAEILLAHALDLPRIQLYVQFERPMKEDELARFKALILRRSKREPLAYITGKTHFMSLEFEITPAVLVPRQETERLAEIAIETSKSFESPEVLDLCCGSGVIGVSIARYVPAATIAGTDISPEAVLLSKRNADRNGTADRCDFLAGDLFAPVAGRKFDVIVSNPPYVRSSEIDALQPEISRFEPRKALDGGRDGLDMYRRLADGAGAFLKDGGALLAEIGSGQASDVVGIFKKTAPQGKVEVMKDLGGIDRVAVVRLS